MKITAYQNLVKAIQNQDGITDRHLPIYIHNYNLFVPFQYQSKTNVLWSTVSFLPSYTERKRILNIHLAISVIAPLGPTHSSIADLSFIFDFSEINTLLKDIFLITIEGPLSGNLSFDFSAETFNANRYVDYDYEIYTSRLTLYLKNLNFQIPSYPMNLYMNINIRDDIDAIPYPRLFPIQVANNILFMPPLTLTNGGQNITFVMLLLFCCENELKTLQISTTSIALPGAFNPSFDITNLLTQQGVPIPVGGFNFQFEPARHFDPVNVDPVDWTQSPAMRQTCFDLQNLYTSVPNANVIILYDDYSTMDIQQPSYMSWLNTNSNQFDIVLLSGYVIGSSQWDLSSFQNTQSFYDTILGNLNSLKKPVLTICNEDGSDSSLLYPNASYNFVATNTTTMSLGGIQLSQSSNYVLNGRYEGDPYSGGGYCNANIFKPTYQTEIAVGSAYARPDVAGYSRDLLFSVNGQVTVSFSLVYGIQPLGALFAKIYVNTQKKDWDFKFILYRKGPTISTAIILGQNQQYQCSRFENCFWNPVVGFGNLKFNVFYDICSVIRNNTLIQISNVDLPNPLSFMNILPKNPFFDPIARQPVFGFSSIFSFFKIYGSGSGFQPIEQFPILTGTNVVLLDITQQYALSYGLDSNNNLYLFIQNVNYGSAFQQWRITDPTNPSVIRTIFAFDKLAISPANYPAQYLSGKWNANNSLKPSCPSISTTLTSTELFVLNIDPGIDPYVLEIRNERLNDLVWSYYINVTYYNTKEQYRTLFYLRNSNLLSINSNPTQIYDARNQAQEFDRSPRWGYFNEYPEWILIPLNLDYDPMMYMGDIEDENSMVGTYMIFNTVTQSYLFFGFGKILEKPISIETFSELVYQFHINQFIFGFGSSVEENNKTNFEELFSPSIPPKPGLPNNTPYEITKRDNVIITHAETNPDGFFQRCAWKNPVVQAEGEELSDGLYMEGATGFSFTLYWVLKRYIVVNQLEDVRLIAYNGVEEDVQTNNGYAVSSNNDPMNFQNNAPSMISDVDAISARWRLTNTSKVLDQSSGLYYIYYDENLKPNTQTNLRIISVTDADNRAIGVNGDLPQPRLVDRSVPIISEWSLTTSSFPKPPLRKERTNYLYKGIVYSLYSYNEIPSGGFLSSARDVVEDDNGWDPSMMLGYPLGDWIYVGDIFDNYFVII